MMVHTAPDKSRDFICPCGKGYFSYAALFTHVKQKHDGKVPRLIRSLPDKSSSPNQKTRGEGRASSNPSPNSQKITTTIRNPAAPLSKIAPLLLI